MSDSEIFPKLQPNGEHLVFESKFYDFYYDDIVHHGGSLGNYAWLKSHSGNGAVMTIPVTPSERYLIIKIYRHPTKQYLWEFPAGAIDGDETPLEAGRRELIEETGVTPASVVSLGSQVPVAGYSGDIFHTVLAEIPEITLDDVEIQVEESIVEARLLSRSELVEKLMSDEISDGVTLAALARYWAYQQTEGFGR
jgi:ADP-ribose pyrophosphatase